MNKKSIFFLSLLVLLVSSVSASGLRVDSSSFNITKMFEEDYQIAITIINDENFTFQNIRFEEDFAEITPLILQPNSNATVSLKIDRDSDFSGELTLRGEYETNIGQSNKTIQVNIDYVNGLSICNMDLIIGDTIQWNNNVLDEIILSSDSDFATILEESNYTKTFNYVEEFDYYAKRNGAKFTEECRVNVMDDSGWVHSLDYDYKIPTEIEIKYEPTTISLTLLETEYEIEYDSDIEDILSIRNTGSNDAKNVHLDAQWIEFDDNDFNLGVGQSKTVSYVISPSIYLTNQTNKTYGIDISVEGNFDSISKNIKVKIPYAKVNSNYASAVANEEFMHDLYYFFCDLFEDDEICIKTVNSVGSTTTIEYTEETITGLLNAQSKLQDEQTLYQKQDLEAKQKMIEQNNETIITLTKLLDEQIELRQASDKSNSTLKLAIGVILFIGLLFMAYQYFTGEAGRDIIKNKAKFEKEEVQW